MPQAIALAITCVIGFGFEDLIEWIICLVLEEFALVGKPAEEAIDHQLLAHARLIREGSQRMVEQAMPVEDSLCDRLMLVVTLVADCAIGKMAAIRGADIGSFAAFRVLAPAGF